MVLESIRRISRVLADIRQTGNGGDHRSLRISALQASIWNINSLARGGSNDDITAIEPTVFLFEFFVGCDKHGDNLFALGFKRKGPIASVSLKYR